MNILCRLGVHDWRKFGKMVTAYAGLTQFRACDKCNKIDYTSCYGNQASPKDVNETVNNHKE